MKAKSITPRLTGIVSSVPVTASIASESPAFSIDFFRRAGYSGKPSGSAERRSTSVSSSVPSSRRIAAYSLARMRRW
jgi:hypothetical protein